MTRRLSHHELRPEAERLLAEACWKPESFLAGRWAERNWLNVPGPFYGAETDTCGAGPPAAPNNVFCDDNGQEFVWRQPATTDEVWAVLDAAAQEPFSGYNWDGDDHWRPDSVLAWWDGRERVREWIANVERLPPDVPRGALVAFAEYLDGELGEDLRRYAEWLSERPDPLGRESR